MKIQTLQFTDITELVETLNLAFSDYIVPYQTTREILAQKIINESLKPEYSPGAFEDGKLIGFILHGSDIINGRKVVYNGGTGVIPDKRGNKITAQLLEFILPKLRAERVSKILLEVITGNAAAIKTYKASGFEPVRTLDCYRGTIDKKSASAFEIRVLENLNWEIAQSFWDWNPSWQNSITAIKNAGSINVTLGGFKNGSFAGYIIYNPATNRIQQFAVDKKYRGQGLGRQLFEHIVSAPGQVFSLINIDNGSKPTAGFLASVGFQISVQQYEMELPIQ